MYEEKNDATTTNTTMEATKLNYEILMHFFSSALANFFGNYTSPIQVFLNNMILLFDII